MTPIPADPAMISVKDPDTGEWTPLAMEILRENIGLGPETVRQNMEGTIDALHHAAVAAGELSITFKSTFDEINRLFSLIRGRLPTRERRYLRRQARYRGQRWEHIK